MSKVAIQGDASGTGTFTIAAPNSNSNYTMTLPTVSGTMMTTATSLDASQIPDGSITSAYPNPSYVWNEEKQGYDEVGVVWPIKPE